MLTMMVNHDGISTKNKEQMLNTISAIRKSDYCW